MDEPTGKRCTRCGETKPLDEFHRNRAMRDGLECQCKVCRSELHRRWREGNPERAREVMQESRRRWVAANPERVREASRRWNAANPEALRETTRRWREANPERFRETSRAAARRQHAANRKAVLDHYGWSCACCGTTKRLGIDHVKGDGKEHRAQIGMGSSHLYRWLIANGFPGGFQVLCGWCNKSKGDGDRCHLDHAA